MPSASSTAVSNASLLPSHMALTSSGRLAATRVPSANEPAASASARSPPPAPTWAKVSANRCGRWEILATAASCASASTGTTRLPMVNARPATAAQTSWSLSSVRQVTHAASRNRSADPAAQPECWVPAIGCEPTYRARGASSSTSSATDALTPATSVSATVGATRSTALIRGANSVTGAASTTRASAFPAASSAASSVSCTANPSAATASRVVGLGDQAETGTAPAAARISEPPINPAPRTQMAGGSGVLAVVTSHIMLGASQHSAVGSDRSAESPASAAVTDPSLGAPHDGLQPGTRTLRDAPMNV